MVFPCKCEVLMLTTSKTVYNHYFEKNNKSKKSTALKKFQEEIQSVEMNSMRYKKQSTKEFMSISCLG